MTVTGTDIKSAQIIWDYMRYEQPLEKADIIFGLGSDDIRIAEHAASLYHRGLALYILFSGNGGELYKLFDETEAETFRKRAIDLGVPNEAIIVENEAQNTGENITKSYAVLESLNLIPNSMVLVQKPFMLRRTYATFMKQWPGTATPRVITSAIDTPFIKYIDDSRYDLNRTINVMIGDLQRIREYPKRGFQVEQDIPDDVWEAYEALVQRGYTKHLLS